MNIFLKTLCISLFASTIFHFSHTAYAMWEDEDGTPKTTPSSQSLVPQMYGGTEGDKVFQTEKLVTIKKIHQAMIQLKTQGQLTQEGDSPTILLESLIELAASERKRIAKLTSTEDVVEFGQPRIGFAVTSTFLHGPHYETLRSALAEKIYPLLLSTPQKEWIEIDPGSIRYKLKVCPVEKAPTTVPASTYNEIVRICNTYDTPESLIGSPQNRTVFETVVPYFQFEDFIRSGCWVPSSELPKTGESQGSYQKALRTLLCANMTCPDEVHVSFLQKPTCGQKHYLLEFDTQHDPKSAVPLQPQAQYSIFRVEFEHKAPEAKTYIPSYTILGMTTDIPLGNLPIIICHPLGPFVPHLEQHYKKALQDAIFMEKPSPVEITEAVGRFCFHWSKTMPWIRGGAAGQEWIAEALYNLHGYQVVTGDAPLTPDLSTFLYWTEPAYLGWYKTHHDVHKKA